LWRTNEGRTRSAVYEPVSELEAELSRLRQENAKLKLEKEILKKAAAYFARESM
jgi:transposase